MASGTSKRGREREKMSERICRHWMHVLDTTADDGRTLLTLVNFNFMNSWNIVLLLSIEKCLFFLFHIDSKFPFTKVKKKEEKTACHLNELKWHGPWIKHQFWDLTKVIVKFVSACNGDMAKELLRVQHWADLSLFRKEKKPIYLPMNFHSFWFFLLHARWKFSSIFFLSIALSLSLSLFSPFFTLFLLLLVPKNFLSFSPIICSGSHICNDSFGNAPTYPHCVSSSSSQQMHCVQHK